MAERVCNGCWMKCSLKMPACFEGKVLADAYDLKDNPVDVTTLTNAPVFAPPGQDLPR